jgi:hypothetical protein
MKSWLAFTILVISFFATVPQLGKTILSGSTGDFSSSTLSLNIVINLLLAIHGYLTKDWGIMAIGVWYSVFWSVLMGFKLNILRSI